jgi:hypothetical protein
MAPHRPSPIGPRESFGTVWTGYELIVFGGSRGDGLARPAGAAYNPASDHWRPIAGRGASPAAAAAWNRFDVDVHDGVVVLQGRCERRSLIPTVVRAVAGVEGVVRVENRLGYDIDDLALAAA